MSICLLFVLIINIENIKYQHLIKINLQKINFYPFLSIFLGVIYPDIILLYLFFIEYNIKSIYKMFDFYLVYFLCV